MKLFRYSTDDPLSFQLGSPINGIDSVMWVERYREPGEFSITGLLSSGIKELLPPGSLVSHIDTLEVMIVENHQLREDKISDPLIDITGRSFETVLNERVVGMNQNWENPPAVLAEYQLPAGYTYNQAVKLVNDHILTGQTINAGDALQNVIATTNVSGMTAIDDVVVKRGSVHTRLVEHLAFDDLGIRIIRKNSWGDPLGSPTNTTMLIHAGVDRRSEIIFSWRQGDLEETEYLWSNKKEKNSALVVGRYVETPVHLGPTGYNRRTMLVDGSDLDDYLSVEPTGALLTEIKEKMVIRGLIALMSQNEVNITRADISKNTSHQYRKEYNIGDLIMLQANHGETASVRVVEHVEIADKDGESSHPTFALL